MALHATAIAIGDHGVLFVGPPGSGKSDLALRLIDRGAMLIADDQVLLEVQDKRLLLSPPVSIAGKLEVRGIGIVSLPFRRAVPAGLIFDLGAVPERLPELASRLIEGIAVRQFALAPFDASAAVKVELAVARCCADGLE